MKGARSLLALSSSSAIMQAVKLWGGDILDSPVMALEKQFIHHGNMTCFDHSLAVAALALLFARMLRVKIDAKSLVRGALLHDLYLYDWHVPDKANPHRLHGIFHPQRALKNAQRYFEINPLESDIILKHMFPLTLLPPLCRESWLVCAADTVCAVREWAAGRRGKKSG